MDYSRWYRRRSLEKGKKTPHIVSTFLRIKAVPNIADFCIVSIDVYLQKPKKMVELYCYSVKRTNYYRYSSGLHIPHVSDLSGQPFIFFHLLSFFNFDVLISWYCNANVIIIIIIIISSAFLKNNLD